MAKLSKGKPSFIWQPVLIVLPVIILAVVGFLFLRQDRSLVRQEAAERAQVLAEEMAVNVWAELVRTDEPMPHVFQVDASGELLFPPPASGTPIAKPFDITGLESQQFRMWQNANREDASGNRMPAIDAYRHFLESKPPAEFAGAAWYALGSLLLGGEDYNGAAQALDTVLESYPSARGESGLPLAQLAEAKLIEIFLRADSSLGELGLKSPFAMNYSGAANVAPVKPLVPVESFYSNIVNHPTALTPYLLNTPWKLVRPKQSAGVTSPLSPQYWGDLEAARQRWLTGWHEQEFGRKCYQAAMRSRGSEVRPQSTAAGGNTPAALMPRLFWFRMDGENWLCSRLSDPGLKIWFECRTQPELASLLAAAHASISHTPKYFGMYVDVGGAIMAQSGDGWFEIAHRQPTGSLVIWSTMLAPSAMLASTAGPESGGEPLKVSVYLADPAALFRHERVRSVWLGSVIAASVVAAIIGLFSARRAFAQQQTLAELKTNFVSSVSHELRAPIASVRLMAESLERGKIQDSGKQSEYFRFIGQECRRLSGLIENVLDFSRIEQGRKKYQFEPTDLLALTRETVALMQTYAAEKRVKLDLLLPPEQTSGKDGREYQMSVDGRAIQQALINLIDNALKHSPEGETVTVGIGLGPEPRAASGPAAAKGHLPPAAQNGCDKLLLWVADRGPGIPAAEHQRIFERFYRLGSELRRETQGVGIGLSIVQHVVEAHHGTVKVESKPGKGSRFTIELPA